MYFHTVCHMQVVQKHMLLLLLLLTVFICKTTQSTMFYSWILGWQTCKCLFCKCSLKNWYWGTIVRFYSVLDIYCNEQNVALNWEVLSIWLERDLESRENSPLNCCQQNNLCKNHSNFKDTTVHHVCNVPCCFLSRCVIILKVHTRVYWTICSVIFSPAEGARTSVKRTLQPSVVQSSQ